MAQIDLGKTQDLIGEDVWISTATYGKDDVVYYEGSSYVSAFDNNTGQNPAVQHALGINWQKMTEGTKLERRLGFRNYLLQRRYS